MDACNVYLRSGHETGFFTADFIVREYGLVFFSAIYSFYKETLAEERNIIRESDEVVVFSNGKTPELKMRIIFKEELSIGSVEGDENYLFGNSVVFNTDKDGNFYVSDVDA
jgi:hypothetical protein